MILATFGYDAFALLLGFVILCGAVAFDVGALLRRFGIRLNLVDTLKRLTVTLSLAIGEGDAGKQGSADGKPDLEGKASQETRCTRQNAPSDKAPVNCSDGH
tara:strand:- start:217 stop:522 length:306 start_codon:yes stop_codon:yes gene_type:complete